MKRAYLVFGPESSGTRMVTSILMAGVCEGSTHHMQTYDFSPPTAERIVWRRSIPHSGSMPDIGGMAMNLEDLGYNVVAIFCMRDWHAMIQSQIRDAQHADTPARAVYNIVTAFAYAVDSFVTNEITFLTVSYEQLVNSEASIRMLLEMCDLDRDAELPPMTNENEKYYQ